MFPIPIPKTLSNLKHPIKSHEEGLIMDTPCIYKVCIYIHIHIRHEYKPQFLNYLHIHNTLLISFFYTRVIEANTGYLCVLMYFT